ncbi:MAG: glycerate kinase [Phycisphaerae bacterium]|nr:glycerate kinase [Phycisphaerae bacterium]
MKIVVALDSFKGSLTAVQACDIVAGAIRSVRPDAEVVTKPMADGGEGTASVLMAAAGGQWIAKTVIGPLPEIQVHAGFVWLPDLQDAAQARDGQGGSVRADGLGDGSSVAKPSMPCSLSPHARAGRPRHEEDHRQAAIRHRERGAALVEMATASGLPLLRPEQRNPLKTTTYGTGELIKAAIDYGASHILLAIGGSATVDGGVGAAAALGWRFFAKDGREVDLGGGQLSQIARIVAPVGSVSVRASKETPHGVTTNVTVEVLCDVDNPLCGEHGAARVFGPQKGATPEMVDQLDAGLAHLARLVREQLGRDIACLPGAGAAGGLAAGAVAFMNGRLISGVEAVMAQIHLADTLAGADWVVTGEGAFDEQSLRGKVVSGVVRIARAAGVKVAVCAGQVRLGPRKYRQAGITAAVACMEAGMELDDAIARGAELLDRAACRFAREHLSTSM